MINFFSKKSDKQLERSLNMYKEILENEVDLKIKTIHKRKIYFSEVEYVSGRTLVFRCPEDKSEIIRFNYGNLLNVDFVSRTGIYQTEILIKEKIISDNILYYKCEIASPVEKIQRRKHYRLPIVLDLKYTILPRESMEYDGHTLDISCNGVLMETYENIFQSKNIKVKMDIEGKEYNIISTIVRKRANYNNGTYLYNIKFNNLSNKSKGELSRFIFDTKRVVINNN